MFLYAAEGTSNLGDFFNCLPVLSGISKVYGNLDLILQDESKKFVGIKELLEYQPFINSVCFQSEFIPNNTVPIIAFNSWVRSEQTNIIRPIETCRYEIRFKETYNMKFNVDDDFILNIPSVDVDHIDTYIIGDRCSNTTSDKRRKCNIISASCKYTGHYLDYSKSLLYNLNLIKKSNYPFITTITGISVLVDLMGIDQILLYDDELVNWQGRNGIDDTFKCHYYSNRKSKLEYLSV